MFKKSIQIIIIIKSIYIHIFIFTEKNKSIEIASNHQIFKIFLAEVMNRTFLLLVIQILLIKGTYVMFLNIPEVIHYFRNV